MPPKDLIDGATEEADVESLDFEELMNDDEDSDTQSEDEDGSESKRGKGEREEVEDNKGEETKESYEDILDQAMKAAGDDDLDVESDPEDELEETEDDNIVDAAYQSNRFYKYLKSRQEAGYAPDDAGSRAFIATVSRNQVDPDFLEQNGIFDFPTLFERMDILDQQTQSDAIWFPKDADQVTLDQWFHEHLGIPNVESAYVEAMNESEQLTPEEKDALAKSFWKNRTPENSVKVLMDFLDAREEHSEAQLDEELHEYQEKQQEDLVKVFGDDWPKVARRVGNVLQKHIPEVLEDPEFQLIKNNANFIKFIHGLIDVDQNLGKLTVKEAATKVQKLSDANLQKAYTQAAKAEAKAEKGTRARQEMEGLTERIFDELKKRGLI